MRDLKSRGLTKDGTRVYGSLYKNVKTFIVTNNPFPPADFSFYCGSFFVSFIEVIPETVGEYIGLKDKNGKEIDWWEDDLLKSLGVNKKIGQIKYDNKCAEWRLYVDGNSWCSLAAAYYDNWKKIGNIHEKPELMEKQE